MRVDPCRSNLTNAYKALWLMEIEIEAKVDHITDHTKFSPTQPYSFSLTNRNGVPSLFYRLKSIVNKEFSGSMPQTQPFMQSWPHSNSPSGAIDSNSSCTLHRQQFLTQPKANDQYASFINLACLMNYSTNTNPIWMCKVAKAKFKCRLHHKLKMKTF